jgi:serine/threonine protein kinase/tetratricopeptide (TPR) repeat protein
LTEQDLAPGSVFAGRYRIVKEQGRGGMGMVLLAEDLEHGRPVALKLILGSGGEAEQLSLRFRREFRAIQRISHPNVVAVYEYGTSGARAFFTMEFVRGQDLAHHFGFAKTGQGVRPALDPAQLNAPERLERLYTVLRQAFEALAALHATRMIHRDLKPGNILVDQAGRVKLIDFGLARDVDEGEDLLTRQGLVVGTIEYMAPEQMLGARLDPRCDLYSMGVILFESLAGRRPYEGLMTRQQLLERPPALRLYNPGVPRAFESITLKLLQKDPFERFQSAEDFLAALDLAWKDRDADLLGSLELSSVRPLRPGAASVLLPQRFVGRGPELDALQLKLSELQSGKGDLVLLAGDAGIGKSRLVEELRVSAHLLGMRHVQGACFPDAGSPYGAFGPVLEKLLERLGRWSEEEQLAAFGPEGRALAEAVPRFAQMPVYHKLPELPALESPEKKRYLVQTAATDLIRAAARRAPLLLVLEDLQWSSAPALELLAHVARSVVHAEQVFGDPAAAAPLLLLGTYRSDEVEGHPIQGFLRQMRGKGLCKLIRLDKLELPDVSEFVASMLGLPRAPEPLVSRLYQESDGNPFFLEEIMKALLEDNVLVRRQDTWHLQLPEGVDLGSGTYSQLKLPVSIKDAVHRRLERLDPEDLALLGYAATLGRQFPFELLLAATERPEEQLLDWLDRMLKAEILVEDRQSQSLFEFYQDKIREVVAGDLPERKRLFYHRRIALAAERLYAADPEPHLELLSQHFYLAGLADQALEYAWRAGMHLKRGFLNDEAIVQLRRALSLLGEKGPSLTPEQQRLRLDCYQALGEILLHVGENREALECFEYLAGLAPQGSAASARAQLFRGIAHSRLGGSDRALEDYGVALLLFDQLGETGSVADCYRETGRVLMFQDRFEEAHAHYKQALDLYKQLGDRLQLAEVLSHLGISYYLQNKDAVALEYFEKALPVFEKLGEAKGIAQSHNRIGTCQLALCRFEEAEQHLGTAVRQLQAIEAMRDVLICQVNQGRVYSTLGSYGPALETQRQAVELGRELEDRYLLAAALRELALVLLRLGAPEQAVAPIEEAISISRETKAASREAMQLYDHGCIREAMQDAPAAQRLYTEAIRLAKQSDNKDILVSSQIRLLRLGQIQPQERKLLWNLLEQVRGVVSPSQAGDIVLVVAEALFRAGREEQAVSVAAEVREQAAQTHQREEHMRAAALLARHAALAGRDEEAWELCDEALGLLHDIAEAAPEDLRPACLQTPFAQGLLSLAERFVSLDELAEAFEDLGVDLARSGRTRPVTQESLLSTGAEARVEFLVRSEPMARLHERLRRLATSAVPVFLYGEPGSGKSTAAALLHALSGLAGPFVVLASEGLDQRRLEAQLARARGGLLYVDELGRVPAPLQAGLAQWARSQQGFLALGSRQTLPALARSGRFDPQLQRSLDGRLVEVPALRQRREDILPLAQLFLRRQALEQGVEVRGLSKAAEEALLRQDWPGNVAELEIQVCRAVLLCEGQWLEPEHFELAGAAG